VTPNSDNEDDEEQEDMELTAQPSTSTKPDDPGLHILKEMAGMCQQMCQQPKEESTDALFGKYIASELAACKNTQRKSIIKSQIMNLLAGLHVPQSAEYSPAVAQYRPNTSMNPSPYISMGANIPTTNPNPPVSSILHNVNQTFEYNEI
jgi:hypothetical protein